VTSSRRLGLLAAAAIVIANMIGTGVFTSTGFQAASLRDPTTILLAWVVGGVFALCGAFAYAELGAMMPRVGGEYVYLRAAYHPVVGLMSGWASFVAGFSAPIATAALAFAYYGGAVAGVTDPTAHKAIAIGLIVLATGLHGADAVVGGRVQAVLAWAKAALIVVFVAAGLLVGDGTWANLAPRAGGLGNAGTMAFLVSLLYVSFAYSGWNAAAYIAGEIDRPERNLPRALILGTALVTALYLLLNVVFLYAVPVEVLGAPIKEVGDAAAHALFGDAIGRGVSTLIALALVSSVSAMIMAGPRVYAAIAEDGALPSAFAARSRRGAPVIGVLLQGALAIGFVLASDLRALIDFVAVTLTLFAALTVAAVFVLRVRAPALARPYRTLGYPLTPALFLVIAGLIVVAGFHLHRWNAVIALGLAVVIPVGHWLVIGRPGRAPDHAA
jgi:APA family basic amino acid/polyamine antiporter